MASQTPAQVKDQIVTLMAAVSGITTSVDDYGNDKLPFTAAELPAAVTRLLQTPASRRWVDHTTFEERRTFTVLLHVRLADAEMLAPDTTDMEACEVFLRSVPEYFAARRTLSKKVWNSDPMSDSGITRLLRDTQPYWGIVFQLVVIDQITVAQA